MIRNRVSKGPPFTRPHLRRYSLPTHSIKGGPSSQKGILSKTPSKKHGESFVYDSFRLAFNNIDSLQFAVPSDLYDNTGSPVDWAVNTVISDLVGTLSIDAPNNKSGLKDYPEPVVVHAVA